MTLRRAVRQLVAAGVLLLLAGEGLPRLFGMKPFQFGWPRGLFLADPRLGIRMDPGFEGFQEEDNFWVPVRVNALGMRGAEVTPKADGEVRILCLGDGETFGHGVEEAEAWPARLEEALRGRGLASVRVLNAGVMSYGPRQEARWLAKLAPEVQPDLAVVGFTVSDDFFDCLGTPLTVQEGYPVGADFPPFTWTRRLRWLLKYHSTTWRLLASLLDDPEVPLLCTWHPAIGLEAFRIEPGPEIGRALETLAEIWRGELAAAAGNPRVPVLVVPIPTRFQIHPEFWKIHRDRCSLDEMLFDQTIPQRRLRDLARDVGLAFADPRERLLQAAAEGPLYQTEKILQSHVNARGHLALAEAVAEAILAQSLLAGR